MVNHANTAAAERAPETDARLFSEVIEQGPYELEPVRIKKLAQVVPGILLRSSRAANTPTEGPY
jgi:hypothetical protein